MYPACVASSHADGMCPPLCLQYEHGDETYPGDEASACGLLCILCQDEDLVGPAKPPPIDDADEGDAWDDRGRGEPDEVADPYRLPITSEVALEGVHWLSIAKASAQPG